MRYLLDTNICIYVINERPAGVIAQFLAHETDGIGVSAITASELYWGVQKSGSRRNLAALGTTLVTNNQREFKRVPGLSLSNWA